GHSVRLYPRQSRINLLRCHRVIDGGIRRVETVGRAVMAIEAIHRPDCMVRRVILEIRGAILGDFTSRISEANPGNDLPLRVCGALLDFILRADMPMDAFDDLVAKVSATDFQNEADRKRSIRFIREKVRVGAIEAAAKFLRPMTLFARFAGGPEIVYWGLDR